jgi:hypothetical protein
MLMKLRLLQRWLRYGRSQRLKGRSEGLTEFDKVASARRQPEANGRKANVFLDLRNGGLVFHDSPKLVCPNFAADMHEGPAAF